MIDEKSLKFRAGKAGGTILWLCSAVAIALAAFNPIYPWIPKFALGMMWFYNLVMLACCGLFGLSLVALAATDGEVKLEKEKTKEDHQKALESFQKVRDKYKKGWRIGRLIVCILFFLVCGFSAGFIFTTLVDFVLTVTQYLLGWACMAAYANAYEKTLANVEKPTTPEERLREIVRNIAKDHSKP